jgi:2-polyprenyl-6-methoxyphenol hydroxylase-like FAD-dependent oxidoreductase
VLSESFDAVQILDRDFLPDGAEFRAGVPQSRHVHQLLVRGAEILEELEPGTGADLAAAGAHRLDIGADFATYAGSAWAPRAPTGLMTWSASRERLEAILRRRILARPGISLVDGAEVVGLTPGTAGITVRLRWRARAGESEIQGQLLVDTSGAGSHLPKWLAALGYPAPPESRIASYLSYSSREFTPPPGFTADWKALYVPVVPPILPHGGLLAAIEGGRWLVTLSSIGEREAPVRDERFLGFTRNLAHPALHDALRDATAVTPVTGFRRPGTTIRHYERMARMPEGVIVLGDAAAAFNPIYGQGMTAAALAAMTLRQALAGGQDPTAPGFAARCQKRIATHFASPFALAAAQDLVFPGTSRQVTGWRARLGTAGPTSALLARAIRNAAKDPGSYRKLLRVVHLIDPLNRLLPGR